MKDLLAKLAELDKDIKTINETTNPLGETASMNISMTGDNADEVAQLVNIMRTGNTPDAKAVSPMDMPSSDHMPMDKALSIVKMPMDGPMDMDGPADSPMDDMPRMGPKDDEADEDMSGGFSSSTTEPDEQYFDTQTMTRDLAGGINREKGQHAPAADGDNPIAVEDDLDAQIESIKDELYAALAEKKKPDADGDGVPDWADKKPGEDDHADDEADIDEGAMSNIHAEIEAADDRAQATMELIDKNGPEGKYLYNELEKLAAKQGTTLSVDDEGSMPEDFIGDLLDDMGISAYKDEAATEDMSGEGTYTIKVKGKNMDSQNELARLAGLPTNEVDDEMEAEAADGGFGNATTEPDEAYGDTQLMTKDLSGGINGEKKMHKPAADGDNPMAVEAIKAALYAALTEKKMSEGEVPAGLKAYQAKKGKGKAPAKGKSKSGKMPMDAGKDGKKGTKDDKPAFLKKEEMAAEGRGRGKKTKVMAGRGRGK